jgi:peptidyl-prolyl cis-trans isomerase D
MLMSLMRKHAKSWLIKLLIGMIAAVFVFYFGYSFSARRAVKIAYVNGDVISGKEYQKSYRDLLERLQRQYRDVWNDNLIKAFDLRNRALDNLINQKLISQEANRLGLEVTDTEIQKAIMEYPAFQVNGQFDVRRYKSLLSQNRMDHEDFEQSIALDLLDDKLKQFLFSFMEVTDQELLDYYTFNNEKIKISFVLFKPDDFKKSIKVDQGSMEAFFKEHKEDYRIPEKVKLAYLLIDPRSFRDQVKPTEREISDYYEFHTDTYFQPKQVRARHILFKVSKDATEAEETKIREKAEEVLKEARQGKDFAALARKYSEGPTKSKGGDLGYFSAGHMVKAFEDVAFSLKVGEISDLVRTPFGYHIIKVEDIKEAHTKTLEEVRSQIVESLIAEGSTELAHEKGLSLIDQMPYDADLAQYAANHGLAVKYTDYFSQDEPIPSIRGSAALRKSLFSLEKNETSELVELKGKFYLFQVVDRKESYLPGIEEVAEKVKGDFTNHLAAKEATASAENYLAELKGGKAWEVLARDKDLKPEETDFFTRQGPIKEIGGEPALKEMLFGLSKEKRYPDTIFENNQGAFVFRWEAYQGIDDKRYEDEKEEQRFSLMQIKHRRAFDNWLDVLKNKAEIEIVTPVAGE